MSDIWKFCDKVGVWPDSQPGHQADCVQCNICKKKFKQVRGSTSSVAKHLRKQHPRQFFGDDKPTTKNLSLASTTLKKLAQFKSADSDSDATSSNSKVVSTPLISIDEGGRLCYDNCLSLQLHIYLTAFVYTYKFMITTFTFSRCS